MLFIFLQFIACAVTWVFDFATRLHAAGFIRPKIKISLPVGRGARAEREEATRPARKKELFYKLQEWPSYLLSH